MNLYTVNTTAKETVKTTAKEYDGCRDVVFCWFRHPMPRITRCYSEIVVEELFTWDEAQQLVDYLKDFKGSTTVVEEYPLPVEPGYMGKSCIAVGGGDDFYELPGYALPFKVSGYFNLVGRKGRTRVDNGDTYRHRLFIVQQDPNGEVGVHKETNAEVAARERAREQQQDAIARGDYPF